VSGDDQLVFAPRQVIDKVYETLVKYTGDGRARGYLGRVCDPIHINYDCHFEFISLIFDIKDGIVTISRLPEKVLFTALVYTGKNKTLSEDPKKFSHLVGSCLSISSGQSHLLRAIAQCRLRIGRDSGILSFAAYWF